MVAVLAVGVLAVVSLIRYKNWEQENVVLLESFAVTESDSGAAISALNEKIMKFQESRIESESLSLDCAEVEVLFEEILSQNYEGLSREDVGVICGERSLDLYVRVWDRFWVAFKLWQRAEGKVDFVVHDVKLGPISVGNCTFGYVTEKMTDGLKDGQRLVLEGGYSEREITEIYLGEDGVRAVGVRNTEAK